MTQAIATGDAGSAMRRVDGPDKVRGTARYAFEYPMKEPAYLHLVQSTITRGRVRAVHDGAALAVQGVLAVLSHTNATRIDPGDETELAVLQSDGVAYRGQPVAAVVAKTPEAAREAAALVGVDYDVYQHDVHLSAARTDLFAPDDTDTHQGDLEAAMAEADTVIDHVYSTPMQHNNPMEPHATIALWDGTSLILHESTQAVRMVHTTIASLFGLERDRVRVIAPYVGGGFGAKGPLHAPVVLACLAAMAVPGRPVKLAVTRRQMFTLVGYRSPTLQRVRLAADAQGRLSAVGDDVTAQSARFTQFVERAGDPSRMMYAAPNRRITHRLAALDTNAPTWMRAPGEAPGMFAPEVAMDELACALDIDPVELRLRNEPEVDPGTHKPFSSRTLAECMREGSRLFGWADRDPAPGVRRHDGWLVGTGMAASTYPALLMPGSSAEIRFEKGRYELRIGASDIGTGAWTVLGQLAAEALGVGVDAVRVHIGDSTLPAASLAGGSSGTVSWGTAITAAARAFREEHGDTPAPGARTTARGSDGADENYSAHSFGAQFAEVHVHADTGEVRVPRLLGVFSAGRIINPLTARSQFIGGMTMGVSMALHEHSVVDPRFGHVVTQDFADYHISVNADIGEIRAEWIDTPDYRANPTGAKGIGEIGITGTAAAVANAFHHATGVRVRDLPITVDAYLLGSRG
ncbi:xanthine dehydrogenase family protein molybdopterin-binding subunit [Nocardiopsis ansamitocini]|uniref:Xanthine dehydrogenase n=1 Tax=Nocardiopsis ansamitocini TaxID=1670832 RepID=A0A9W6P6B1_9ACTN|nr:xanthine dehydrogenase family protein molybdopterin-binding subunit [Nocardiopsis ansamitocini]GLU48239.1 xanthine dehydrogenase [Nocardiopsis ansamitocini]